VTVSAEAGDRIAGPHRVGDAMGDGDDELLITEALSAACCTPIDPDGEHRRSLAAVQDPIELAQEHGARDETGAFVSTAVDEIGGSCHPVDDASARDDRRPTR